MTKTALLLTAFAIALATMLSAQPTHAQQRVFVSGSGVDQPGCGSVSSPCRSFQYAFNVVTAVTTSGGEIDVLDPAGYGPLTITHGISIQAHGFGGITQATSGADAITISAGSSDAISLNGLLIDGADSGLNGIFVNTAGSVQILNCVIRHFTLRGIDYEASTNPTVFLVSDTVASDNGGAGILFAASNGNSDTPATLSGITANNNKYGVALNTSAYLMITGSVMSNNSNTGLQSNAGTTWLGTSTITGNLVYGVDLNGGTVNSYVDNQINGNTTDKSAALTDISPE